MKRLTLTKKQRALQKEISDLLRWLHLTPDLTELDAADRTSHLTWGKRELITSAILGQYLLTDEHLNNEMCREFFPRRTYAKLWRTKRFRAFNYYILERLYLVQKVEFVRSCIRLPKKIYKDILALNDLRNAVAHSFFPENRRVKRKWKGTDVFSYTGIGGLYMTWQASLRSFFLALIGIMKRDFRSHELNERIV